MLNLSVQSQQTRVILKVNENLKTTVTLAYVSIDYYYYYHRCHFSLKKCVFLVNVHTKIYQMQL